MLTDVCNSLSLGVDEGMELSGQLQVNFNPLDTISYFYWRIKENEPFSWLYF